MDDTFPLNDNPRDEGRDGRGGVREEGGIAQTGCDITFDALGVSKVKRKLQEG
jgi:hypothetical protein